MSFFKFRVQVIHAAFEVGGSPQVTTNTGEKWKKSERIYSPDR